ncbi:hypothetical protein BC793_10392 [Actinoplanes xinjiangensis]|uniref:Uncharacterized protein n=1 Tax=Actinoplanes xinjiangensis TaxID=512350 RepID=A0A316FMT2_9ACTN|nr:hypothetical protein BC793_10392 [Actinoplanes xinjiangensis]
MKPLVGRRERPAVPEGWWTGDGPVGNGRSRPRVCGTGLSTWIGLLTAVGAPAAIRAGRTLRLALRSPQ